jgi:hypothetical protein
VNVLLFTSQNKCIDQSLKDKEEFIQTIDVGERHQNSTLFIKRSAFKDKIWERFLE